MHSKKIILTTLCIAFVSLALGQGKIQLGLHGGLGQGTFQKDFSDVTTPGQLGFRGQLDVTYFFIPNLGISTGVGFGAYQGQFELSNIQNSSVVVDGANSPYTVLPGNTPVSYTRTDSIKSLNETIRYNALEIPLLLKFQYKWLFVEAGPLFSFPLTSSFDGSGQISYSGEFDLPGGDVAFNNTGFGFDTYDISGTGDWNANSFSIAYWGSLGGQFNIGSNTAVRVGIGYRFQNNMLADNTASSFRTRVEGDEQYYPFVESDQTLNLGLPFVQVGITQSFGGSSAPSGKKDLNCPPSQMIDLPVTFDQPTNDRRNSGFMDEDLERIIGLEATGISVKKATYIPESNLIQYCVQKTEPQNISARFSGSSSLDLDSYKFQGDEMILSFTSSKKTSIISLDVTDQNGDDITDYNVTLLLEGEPIWTQTMNNGDPLTYIYKYPDLYYVLNVQSECYYSAEMVLDVNKNYSSPIEISMNQIGGRMDLEFPVTPKDDQVIAQQEPVAAKLFMPSGDLPFSGSLGTKVMSLKGGCSPDDINGFQMELMKPLGYDLYREGNEGNWASRTFIIDIVNSMPQSQLFWRKLPEFHLYYVDLSDFENSYLVRGALKDQMNAIQEQQDSLMVFFSRGEYPLIRRYSSEQQQLLNDMEGITIQTPNAQEDMARLANSLDLFEIIPDRRKVVLHFALSNQLYNRSKEIIIMDFLRESNLMEEEVEIRIMTEDPVPPNMRFQESGTEEFIYEVIN